MGINKSTPADEISDEDDDFVTPAKQFGKTKNVSMNRQGEKRTYETNACRCTERRNKVTKKKDRETEVIVSEIYVSCSLPMFFKDVTRILYLCYCRIQKKVGWMMDSGMVVEQVH